MSTDLVPFSSLSSPYARIEQLEREVDSLKFQLSEANKCRRNEEAKNEAIGRGVAELRTILSPLYRALQYVFGEIDAMAVDHAGSAPDVRRQAVWESWKSKLPSGEAKAIDALLLHGAMTTGQLRIHVGCATRTAQNIVTSLKSKGLVEKNGAQVSLKEL